MEYQVPQFIEVEDKIIGPLTLKQFIYIAGGAGLCVVFFTFLPFFLAALLSLPIAVLTWALAFYKVNGKPFIEVLEAGFNYWIGAKLFLWKHQDAEVPQRKPVPVAPETHAVAGAPRLSRGKLSELAWSLDVNTEGGAAADREK
ncbi:MAG: PrgI family protein [Minisyncoccia bacterium]